MSQCVPSWDLDESTSNSAARLAIHADPSADSTAPDVPMLDYEVAELTWENGQLAMHCLGPPRVTGKPLSKYAWEKPRAGGTLESVVKQATLLQPCKALPRADDLVPWFDHHRTTAASLTMDALVPCSKRTTNSIDDHSNHVRVGTCLVGSSTRVGSCSGAAPAPFERRERDENTVSNKRTKGSASREESSFNQSVSGSDTFGRESTHVTLDTCDVGVGVGFTSTSLGSPDNTSSGKHTTIDDYDSVCNSRPQRQGGGEDEKKGQGGRCSVSTKRNRAAAIHNQSERKRRDRITQRMKTLQKLVPNSSKTDKASMLDEVIEYLKHLQAQVQMMSRMNNIPHMMMPMAMQQLQMSMMAQMGMGMGMGMPCVMDMNSIGRPNPAGIPPMIHPAAAFLPFSATGASWDGSGDRLPSSGTVLPDPFSAFLACQTSSMNMDAYNRMAALYQQFYQQTQSNAKT